MKIFRVVPALGGDDDKANIEFFGDEPTEVFRLLRNTRSDEQFTLWEGEKCLGILRRNQNGFWELR